MPKIELIQGDCLEKMKDIPDGSVNYVITSPPYNIATKRTDCYYNNGYSHQDGLPEADYINSRTMEFTEFKRILYDDGLVIYNLSYHSENPSLPIKLLYNLLDEWTVVEMVSWKKGNAIPFQTSPRKLSRVVEMIYVLCKKGQENSYTTNKQKSKVNTKTGQTFYKNDVNFVEARNNDKIATTNKATYSTELVEKLLVMFAPIGSIILDPFMGVGTTGMACKNLNRNFIGIELDEVYFKIAEKRINENL